VDVEAVTGEKTMGGHSFSNTLPDGERPFSPGIRQDDGKLVIAGHLANSLDDSTPHFAVLRILADYDTLFVSGFDPAP